MSFSPKACLSRGSRPQSCPKTPLALVLLLVACLFFHLAGPCEASRATLLVPSKPSIESLLSVTQATEAGEAVAKPNEQEKSKKSADEVQKSKQGEKNGSKSNESAGKADAKPDTAEVCEIVDAVNASIQASIAPQQLKEEVDLLIVGMEAFRYRGVAIDPPRIFTIYRFDKDAENPRRPARREDRLGDIEEIRYLNQKAWGANVGLDRPGLYEFVIETQPWWEPFQAGYAQHIVKTMLPVYGEGWGWHLPLGLSFEIVPATRPFGLLAPALFTGRVLVNGKPVTGLPVRIFRINTENVQVPTPWHEEMELRTTENGLFSVVLNRPGWWCCAATQQGAPLKGPGGQPSPLYISTLFWFYVDGQAAGN